MYVERSDPRREQRSVPSPRYDLNVILIWIRRRGRPGSIRQTQWTPGIVST
jgi:hypothetical protein